MDYIYFYIAFRRYAKRKITRAKLIDDLIYAQQRQGIKPKVKSPCGTKWMEAT